MSIYTLDFGASGSKPVPMARTFDPSKFVAGEKEEDFGYIFDEAKAKNSEDKFIVRNEKQWGKNSQGILLPKMMIYMNVPELTYFGYKDKSEKIGVLIKKFEEYQKPGDRLATTLKDYFNKGPYNEKVIDEVYDFIAKKQLESNTSTALKLAFVTLENNVFELDMNVQRLLDMLTTIAKDDKDTFPTTIAKYFRSDYYDVAMEDKVKKFLDEKSLSEWGSKNILDKFYYCESVRHNRMLEFRKEQDAKIRDALLKAGYDREDLFSIELEGIPSAEEVERYGLVMWIGEGLSAGVGFTGSFLSNFQVVPGGIKVPVTMEVGVKKTIKASSTEWLFQIEKAAFAYHNLDRFLTNYSEHHTKLMNAMLDASAKAINEGEEARKKMVHADSEEERQKWKAIYEEKKEAEKQITEDRGKADGEWLLCVNAYLKAHKVINDMNKTLSPSYMKELGGHVPMNKMADYKLGSGVLEGGGEPILTCWDQDVKDHVMEHCLYMKREYIQEHWKASVKKVADALKVGIMWVWECNKYDGYWGAKMDFPTMAKTFPSPWKVKVGPREYAKNKLGDLLFDLVRSEDWMPKVRSEEFNDLVVTYAKWNPTLEEAMDVEESKKRASPGLEDEPEMGKKMKA